MFNFEVLSAINWPFHARQKRILKERGGYVKSDFISFFQGVGVDAGISESVWNALIDVATVKDFRPMPEDRLGWVYGLSEEDLDEDIVLEILKKHRRSYVDGDSDKALVTVYDLVEFISTRPLK